MNKIYKEARRCYKNQEFPGISIRTEDDGTATAWSKKGKFLMCFASRLVAERTIQTEAGKASKFIQ